MHIHLFVQRLSVNRITQKRMLRFFWVWNWKYRDSGEFDPLQKSLVPCTTSKMGWSGIDFHPFHCKLLAVGVTPGALPMPTHNYRLPPPLLKFDKYMNNFINLFHTEYWFYTPIQGSDGITLADVGAIIPLMTPASGPYKNKPTKGT